MGRETSRLLAPPSANAHQAVPLTAAVLSQLMLAIGRIAPIAPGERLYRADPSTAIGVFEFGEGDYLIMDLDSAGNFKLDGGVQPLVRTVHASVYEATYNRLDTLPLGCKLNPIPRKPLADWMLPIMREKRHDARFQWIKVSPTLVLYPNVEELNADGTPATTDNSGMRYQVPGSLRTILQTKAGKTFEEAMTKVHGKALLMNFCTPFLEAYPKDCTDCAKIYDMEKLDANVVPESDVATLAQYLQSQLAAANPLTKHTAMEASRVAEAMVSYRKELGREGMPWRLAYNRNDATTVAVKLSAADISQLLTSLGRTQPFMGERLYRVETYDPHYEFGEGDYLIMDVDPKTGDFKLDEKAAVSSNSSIIPLVRTVNETSFETTYTTVASRSASVS